jgi:hypothetical protein
MQYKTMRWITGLGTAAMLLTITGCQSTPKDERSEGRALDDKKITENIRKDLQTEPTYKFSEVDVSTFAGIVQLSGFVNTQGEKDRAEQIAQDERGVSQVVNGIALKPEMPATSRPNSTQRIYSDPANASSPSAPATSPKDKD